MDHDPFKAGWIALTTWIKLFEIFKIELSLYIRIQDI